MSLIFSVNAQDYKVSQLATIENENTLGTLQAAIANPFDDNQLITANKQGNISVFSIKQQFSHTLITNTNVDNAKLVTIAFHPNFTHENEFGFATLYTSHIEPEKLRGRVQTTNENHQKKPTFEAVIYEWKMRADTNIVPLSARKREVFRVAVDNDSSGINNIRFNPYLKPWQDTFGLMYFSINRAYLTADESQPSNAILRIRPEKFGLKTYTLVNNGIDTANNQYHSAILIGNLGHVKYFSWSKQSENFLQIAIDTPPSMVLVQVPYGELMPDLTQVRPLLQLKSDDIANAYLTYHKTKISQLRHHLLYLYKHNEGWELTALNTSEQNEATFLWQLPLDILSTNGNYALITSRSGNLMLIDYDNHHLFSISALASNGNPPIERSTTEKSIANKATYHWFWLLLAIFALVLIGLWHVQRKNASRKLLKQKYARFTFESSNNKIHLFKRHAIEVDTSIAINRIKQCNLLLNDKQILSISMNDNAGFTNEKEAIVNKCFAEEKRRKMIEGEVRKVEVVFIDDKHSYACCVYLREGNQRYTKAKFVDICEYLIEWCWYYSVQVNPSATSKRITPAKTKRETIEDSLRPAIKKTAQMNTNTTQHSFVSKQQNLGQQSLEQQNHSKQNVNQENTSISPKHDELATAELKGPLTSNSNHQNKFENASPATKKPTNIAAERQDKVLDSQIIESLDKLSQLKQAGHLTEDEFNQAKAKLLRDLTGI